jgi:hypothetical protein
VEKKIKLIIITFTGQSPNCPILKTKIMTQEERDTAIAEAFYNCTIHSIVTNTHSREGLHRLEWIKDKLNKVPVVYDLQRQNFNHRYILDVLEDAIKRNKEFNEDFNKRINIP